jgi:protein-disulfide isomerase
MKRYALPLIIFAIIAGLIALIIFGGSGTPDYSGGKTTVPPIAEEWVRGSATSTTILVEYSDFQCPACKAYEPLVEQMVAKYGDRVAFVYREFPLYQIHVNADAAARAAEAAGKQGKFWEMHDLLFANQATRTAHARIVKSPRRGVQSAAPRCLQNRSF